MSASWLRNRPLVYNPVPVVKNKPKRFHIGRILWSALKRAAMLIGFVFLISTLFSFIMLSRIPTEKPIVLPAQMVLHYNLSGEIKNKAGAEAYLAELGFMPPEITLPDLIKAIDRGAGDVRVKGFVLTMNNGAYSLSQIQELRDAVKRFKASGKFTKIYAASFGEIGSGLGVYYLAAAFDEIWMQPVGIVSITGLYAQSPYFKGLFDRFGIEPEFFGRKEYKTAMENLTSKGMSGPSREMMQSVINSMGDVLASDIARDRSAVSGNFRALMDVGLFTDRAALDAKLVDHVNYDDELRGAIRLKIFNDATSEEKLFVPISAYLKEPVVDTAKVKIAHIYLSGAIIEHMDGGAYQLQENFIDAKAASKDILAAAQDKDIAALVIELNSPGGSPSASETIRRAMVTAKEKYKKPIYVVMKDAAASGGYWISADATKIYARPTTMTGSIGVVGGKFNIGRFTEAYGVTWDGVQYGDNAGLFAMNKTFSAAEQARYEATLDNVYMHFTARVAEGRKLTAAQVEQIAKGRVWTGAQAKQIGLVDELGGMNLALNDLAKALGQKTKADLKLINYPREISPLDAFRSLLSSANPLGGVLLSAAKVFGINLDIFMMPTERMVYEPSVTIF